MESEFFGEWVLYIDEDDKKEAYEYLRLWKKYFLQKNTQYEFIKDRYVDRNQMQSFDGTENKINTLGIKIECRRIL